MRLFFFLFVVIGFTVSAQKFNPEITVNELKENVGYLAVSLGFYKTLFSAPGSSTSSEIQEDEQKEMGLSEGLIRFSIGLDNDIERTYQLMKSCMKSVGVLS